MKSHPNELFLYYNPSHSVDKQMRAYAKAVSNHVNEINIEKEPITSTGWQTILDKLHLRPKDLLNRAHPDYQNLIAGRTWDDEGWLNILIRNPHLLKAPIAIKRERAVLCLTPNNLLELD
ncbi:arsenate reductase family protein [Mariniradius sediminis]|jgi:arsenate reductase (glutaredoxin)|uniref:Glutaredoxin n=1 Tax=Mariniradius sediminis TaxID=2909237 RepID=A0ABS9BVN7_9BACT|nr:glutaredoxin [Mariniradius sediminis]MCF1752132.1 glutaredoxin [Mariniradius sediminis]